MFLVIYLTRHSEAVRDNKIEARPCFAPRSVSGSIKQSWKKAAESILPTGSWPNTCHVLVVLCCILMRHTELQSADQGPSGIEGRLWGRNIIDLLLSVPQHPYEIPAQRWAAIHWWPQRGNTICVQLKHRFIVFEQINCTYSLWFVVMGFYGNGRSLTFNSRRFYCCSGNN